MRFTCALVLLLAACDSTPGGGGGAGDDLSASSDAGAVEDAAMPAEDLTPSGPCPPEMALVPLADGGVCVDRYEGYVVEVDGTGGEKPHSPYVVVDNLTIRAKNGAGQVPQGYISQVQATAACASAGKRLCSAAEFAQACSGGDPTNNYYPYGGKTRIPGACNEGKGSSVARFFGSDPTLWTYAEFNDPILNQWDGGLAPSGSYPKCVSTFGIYDCVGNLHEWGSDPADAKGHGRFRGGFYGDAEINGPGCRYVTSAHELAYHDYSTGFRCCAAPRQ
jgi:hypothetical protein